LEVVHTILTRFANFLKQLLSFLRDLREKPAYPVSFQWLYLITIDNPCKKHSKYYTPVLKMELRKLRKFFQIYISSLYNCFCWL